MLRFLDNAGRILENWDLQVVEWGGQGNLFFIEDGLSGEIFAEANHHDEIPKMLQLAVKIDEGGNFDDVLASFIYNQMYWAGVGAELDDERGIEEPMAIHHHKKLIISVCLFLARWQAELGNEGNVRKALQYFGDNQNFDEWTAWTLGIDLWELEQQVNAIYYFLEQAQLARRSGCCLQVR